MMRVVVISCCIAVVFLIVQTEMFSQPTNDVDQSGYHLVSGWPGNATDSLLGQPAGLSTDSKDHVVVFHRANVDPDRDPLVLIPNATVAFLDATTGKVLRKWGNDLFILPHGLTVDQEDNVWVTDSKMHQVFKFDAQGKMLMKLGVANEPGDDALHFNRPTDVAIAKDGSFYVSDGYGNSRVVKFSKEGKYLFEWGSKGSAQGEFNLPHAIDLDSKGNVYVADRENARVQKFNMKGEFLAEWKSPSGAKVYALKVLGDKVFVVDYLVHDEGTIMGSDIIVLDNTNLELLTQFGRSAKYTGPICRYHDIAIDEEENIFVADLLSDIIQKFKPVER